MILAAPLVIPFAEAVGISVASIGMAKAADMVNDYIQENPEQSVKILSAIVPNVGIGQIFANKKDSGDEEVSEDIDVEVEEKPKKLSGREKGMRIKEAIRRARAGKGNYSSPDAEGSAVDIRGSVIREVEDMGIADKDLKDNYDPNKPKFDYKRFIRPKKADGGAIGIEVLFGEKKPRKNFFMGGPALEGPALGIYNSMKAYQSFTDQEIADAIKQAGYSLPTADSGTTPPPGDSTPGSSQPSGNNDGRSAPPVGSVLGGSGLIGDYMTAIEGRQDRLTNPNVPTSFISSLTGGGQRDIGEMIRSGEVDTRKSSGIPFGIGSAIARMMPDKYYDMSLADQVFTQSQMGYTGPTVFGENSMGNKDPFGLNVRSGFGNYAEAVGSNFNQLRDTLTKDRAGVTFNEETGLFEGVNADAVNKQTEMIRNKYNFRKQQLGVKNVLDSKIKAADTQREKERLAAEVKAKAEAAAKQKIRDAEKAESERVAAAEKAAAAKAKKQRDMQAKIKAAEKAERDRVAAAEKAAAAKAKKQRDMQAQIKAAEKAERDRVAAAEKAAADKAKKQREMQQKIRDAEKAQRRNNGGGGGREDRGPGASSRGGTSATDSSKGNLGFSDIRLKENVELIGKSPSNINIYKFNYKDNSTTYQGAMAHEVPWASVKHSNGYMMIDYNQIDVDFKKI